MNIFLLAARNPKLQKKYENRSANLLITQSTAFCKLLARIASLSANLRFWGHPFLPSQDPNFESTKIQLLSMHTHKTRVWKKTVKQKMTKRWTRNLAVFPPTLGAMQVVEPLILKTGFTSNQIPKLPLSCNGPRNSGKETDRKEPPSHPTFLPQQPSFTIPAFCNDTQLFEIADLLTVEPSFLRSRCGVTRIGNNWCDLEESLSWGGALDFSFFRSVL
jgi:hypothetical protein